MVAGQRIFLGQHPDGLCILNNLTAYPQEEHADPLIRLHSLAGGCGPEAALRRRSRRGSWP